MSRGFCTVTGSFGVGLGNASLMVRFTPAPGSEPSLRAWLLEELLPQLPLKPGFGSAHLFEATATAPVMTREQSIRGADAPVAWAVQVIGYSQNALAEFAQQTFGSAQLEQHGATGVVSALYRLDYSLAGHEVGV
jgi:hypothetical protein